MSLFACAACASKDAEIERATEREKALMKELHTLGERFSAHVDASAHVTAVRAEKELEHGIARQEKRKISGRMPPAAAGLALRGHIRSDAFHRRDLPQIAAPGKAARV